jgi:hypothetical protein
MLRSGDYRHLKRKENPDTEGVWIAYGRRMGPERSVFVFPSVQKYPRGSARGQTAPSLFRSLVSDETGQTAPSLPRYSAATAFGSTSATMSNMIRFSSKSLGV